jgi:Tfp pilus assembly protein PilV
MGVMAFGMLGVVGMQSTLRSNSDVAKQRAEAVRIAQAAVEDWRAFDTLSGGASNFAGIANVAATTVAGDNGTFTRTATVQPAVLAASAPRLKTFSVQVAWADRNGQNQAINIVSSIAGIAPELAGSLGLPADRSPTQRPRGHHPGIPPGAVDQGNGTSVFTPPGQGSGTVSWVFNNLSGLITSTCNPFPGSCTPTDALPLSGFIRYSTGTVAAPTGANAENPVSTALPFGVEVQLTAPSIMTVTCYTDPSNFLYVAYFCALPISTAPPRQWSGMSVLTPFSGTIISSSLVDPTASNFKVCRYTPSQTHTPTGGNINHPLNYVSVTTPLFNQNFLVIAAGDGSLAFGCPADDTSTPQINGNTFRHQPTV